MAVDIAAYMKQLESISERDGVPYARLKHLNDAERAFAEAAQRFKGYRALSDAFKCFFLETTASLNSEMKGRLKEPLSRWYAVFVPRLTHGFQSLCGSEELAHRGYPLHAYTLLRNTFDTLLLTSAALQQLTDFYSIEGIEEGAPLDLVRVRRLRKRTEWDTKEQMTGRRSGLSEAAISELAKWDDLFDFETHGARLSLADAMAWMKGEGPLSVVPKFNELTFGMYMNRYCEIAWMVHRLIPLVQPPAAPLSGGWKKKWRILDESFEVMVQSLTEDCGKPIGAAMLELVKNKFPFNENSHFPL